MFTGREKLIIAGLFLSKFDKIGLANLGFESFTEAFNTIALSLKARPASLKNYRDEFDPLFPNPRQGWHKRPMREYCKVLYERYGNLALEEFTQLLKPLLFQGPMVESWESGEVEGEAFDDNGSFAKRLITGAAAEGYFEGVFPEIDTFHNCALINTTAVGCGFDFKIDRPDEAPYFAVEVKGLRAASGNVLLTEKEHRVASRLRDRYFLFVARHFAEEPFHTLYRDPLACGLSLTRSEKTVVIVNWTIPITG